jgi:hypothetical protein
MAKESHGGFAQVKKRFDRFAVNGSAPSSRGLLLTSALVAISKAWDVVEVSEAPGALLPRAENRILWGLIFAYVAGDPLSGLKSASFFRKFVIAVARNEWGE